MMATPPITTVTRIAENQVRDRARLDALLDAAHIGHVGVAGDTGAPLVIPTAVTRDGDRLLLHGSTGSPWMRRARAGAQVCVAVTSFEGLVVARSAFESSIHYRSAVLFGVCAPITDESEKVRALDLFTSAVLPGRVDEVRRPTSKEIAATLVLALPIAHDPPNWSLKVNDGWPEDPDADIAGPAWAGVVPARVVYGPGVRAPDLRNGIEIPSSVRGLAES